MTRQEALTIGDTTIKVHVDDISATRLRATPGDPRRDLTYAENRHSAMLRGHRSECGFSSPLAALAPGRPVLDIGTGPVVPWARETLRLDADRAFRGGLVDEEELLLLYPNRTITGRPSVPAISTKGSF